MSWHGCGFFEVARRQDIGGCWEVMLMLGGRRVRVWGRKWCEVTGGFHVSGNFGEVEF